MKDLKATPSVSIWNRNFICMLLVSFLFSVSHFSIHPLVASYALHLGAGAYIMGLLIGLFFGVALLMRPIVGPVITKFDKRKLMILVFGIGCAANFGYALFDNISAFITFRLLHGLQYALVGPLTLTLAGDSLPKEKMASGLGIYGLSTTIGMAIGPTIGLTVLDFGTNLKGEGYGFTCVFLFAMLTLILAIIPSYILSPDEKTEEEITSTGEWYKNMASVHAMPMAIVMFLVFIGWSLYNGYIVEFANELKIPGISSFFFVLALILSVTRPGGGWLTDKLGLTRVSPPALILFAVSFIIVGSSKSIDTMLVGAAIAAIGLGSFQPAIFSMCILSETPLRRGVASNTLYIGLDLGLFFGPIMGGVVFEMYDYSIMFKSASVLIIIALILFLLFLPAYYRRRRVLEAMEI